MKRLTIIKLGGSLITDKATPFTARPEIIKQMAEEIAEVRQAMPDMALVIGNGAGSFGHFTAHQYGLREGAATPEQFYGLCVTHTSVQRLNTMVIDALLEQKLPAFGLTPSSMLSAENGRLKSAYFEPLLNGLDKGCVVSVFGDGLTDPARGATIFSTEKIFEVCVEPLRKIYDEINVVYIMNAPGVLDDNGEVIPILSAAQDVHVVQTASHDVTGGIVSKVAAACKAAEYAKSVYIIGPEKGNLQQALAGEAVGTQIRLT